MARKESAPELTAAFKDTLSKTKLINVEVDDELKKSFIAYAMAVNVSRAIPDVRDGMKPVHRRILYAMHEMGLTSDKSYKKCAKIVGEVLGKYHPHGDSSVYDALVRLAQDFSINFPLVDGHGNFGSVDGDPPAAYRYTEARLAKLANEMLKEIDKNTVDFYPNFDDTEMQPVVLPSRFPNLLVNGSDGIAVGMATNIPPHNLAECINGCIALLDNPDITIEELMGYIPAPDYPTGALLLYGKGIKDAYMTGKGSVKLRAKAEIEEYANGTRSRIVVTELPYQVNKAELVKYIADCVKDKKLDGISDIKEESDRDGMRVVIEVKRDADASIVLNNLYKHTNLETSNGINLLALVDGEPKVLDLKSILYNYLRHQEDVIIRRTKYDLQKAEEREHIVKGLVIALASIDEVIDIIKHSADKDTACKALSDKFLLDNVQANAILEMKLQRLTSLEVEKLKAELVELDARIADYKDILANESRVKAIIRNDLTEIKDKYPSPRKTEITYDYTNLDIADLIEEEDVVISMTHLGYIKRQPIAEYKSQRRGGKGITAHKSREDDFIENMFVSSTHTKILFFTNFGKVYRIMGYEIPEAQRTAKGRAIVNLLQLQQGEKVQAMLPVEKDGDATYIALATRKGLIKKTALSEFESIRKVGKIAISITEGDELITASFTNGDDEFLLASHDGKCIRFSEKDVRPTGRDTQGVRGIELADDDSLVDMTVLKEGKLVLTLGEHGFGKVCDIDEYRLQNRGGKGIKAGVFNEKTGNLVNMKLVSPESDDVMIIADNGIIIRIHADEIAKIGRDTLGVRVMKTADAGKIVAVAVTEREEDEPETEETENAVDGENGGTDSDGTVNGNDGGDNA